MIAARNQVEPPDAVIAHVGMCETITKHQRLIFTELVVDSRADVRVAAGCRDYASERRGDYVRDRTVVNHVALRVDSERRLLRQRPTGITLELVQQERSLLRGIGIARVPEIVCEVPVRIAAILVGTRLSEDLDFAVAEFVVFR